MPANRAYVADMTDADRGAPDVATQARKAIGYRRSD
jgi:hypothetical protein